MKAIDLRILEILHNASKEKPHCITISEMACKTNYDKKYLLRRLDKLMSKGYVYEDTTPEPFYTNVQRVYKDYDAFKYYYYSYYLSVGGRALYNAIKSL